MNQYVWDGVMHTERIPKEQPVSLKDTTSRHQGTRRNLERGLEQAGPTVSERPNSVNVMTPDLHPLVLQTTQPRYPSPLVCDRHRNVCLDTPLRNDMGRGIYHLEPR